MKIGDYVMILPDITSKSVWISGKIIEIENNSFIGCVISAQTDDGVIYFGKECFNRLV